MGRRSVNVVGIDYSTRHVDAVWLHLDDAHSPMWFRYELHGHDAFDRTRSVADAMPGRSSDYWENVVAVGIEHPGGKFGTGDMLRVQGAILSCIPARMLVEPWPPAKWRKANGLPGNASKEDVFRESVRRHFPDDAPAAGILVHVPGWPQDAHDAHLIAVATRHAITKAAA